MTTSAITVEGVSKRFRLYHERNQSLKAAIMRRGRATFEDFWALSDVTLEVPEGATLGLIGENGSGKSTLLKCMARILRPDAGAIRIRGKVSALLELGAGFHAELSGRENVYLNGSILGLSRKELERKFDEIVGFAGLERFIDSPVKNYSSGMYVRLGFSVAINVDPDVLLVDEVLSVGDAQFQRRCADKFAELRRNGKTIVIVSHGLDTIRTLCDMAAWLDRGSLNAVGDTDEVVEAYSRKVEADRQADVDASARMGSGEGEVTEIEVLDATGSPTSAVRARQPMTVRVHYKMNQPIEQPVFGVAVHTLDGIEVSAATSRTTFIPDKLDGTGYVDMQVAELVLLPGTYDVTAYITNFGGVHQYDFRYRACRFVVEPGEPHGTYGGVMSLGAT
ncbi:MAG: ABC transporter ATP-binding protein, partial [Actinomycetota bacterium]|nr:ABC transporter ATP-binding protein [Actinomycetota bacterium]